MFCVFLTSCKHFHTRRCDNLKFNGNFPDIRRFLQAVCYRLSLSRAEYNGSALRWNHGNEEQDAASGVVLLIIVLCNT